MGNLHGNLHREAKKKYVFAALAASLVLIVILVGTAIGRYQRQFRSEGSVRAKEFYFTSDFLNGGTYTLAPESTEESAEVTFSLGNHADDLRYSEVEIAYTVTVKNTDGTAADGVTVEYGDPGQKLPCDGIRDHEVTLRNLQSGQRYLVEATGTGGYEQTLTATIEVLSTKPVVYKYLDTTSREYVLLTVWAQGYQGNVTITPPAGLIPDNTDPVMETAKTGASITDTTSFHTGSYSSHTYRFFGSGVKVADFTVTYDNGKAATENKPS